MNVSRRGLLLGTASAVALGGPAFGSTVQTSITVGSDARSQALLLRMIRVMYPHGQFSDAPYQRVADGIIGKANGSIGQALMFEEGLGDLAVAGFGEMDDATALDHLRSIEHTPLFAMVRSEAVVALYNDPEVWEILGYEGASYDQGGYINRGFNDLDWLPEPRITEL